MLHYADESPTSETGHPARSHSAPVTSSSRLAESACRPPRVSIPDGPPTAWALHNAAAPERWGLDQALRPHCHRPRSQGGQHAGFTLLRTRHAGAGDGRCPSPPSSSETEALKVKRHGSPPHCLFTVFLRPTCPAHSFGSRTEECRGTGSSGGQQGWTRHKVTRAERRRQRRGSREHRP